eukprot:gnl/MRDRNA2_/MRDRNA2_52354_c0_seq1.p1 gnl/MRDRNA2_/MRDRNA2_52354_c0~~gnl/MRDRNA2_/MRDRNA2_52354_c0_seq1.p1  ORF type:complete len:331 (+),score=63.59 gnl/MRDRNA2_/MRDRNA2_52354_c0_seq1:80-994(+)
MSAMKVLFALLGTTLAEFPADCPNVTVLHDVVGDNWYDGCLGLHKNPDMTTATACEEQCKTDMNCSVWQMTKIGDNEHCYSGQVTHACRSRGSDAALGNFEGSLIAGQRLQHGFINVLSVNSNVETKNLMHYPEKTGTESEQILRCKQFCYTDVSCTVWQYGKDGCWIEHAPNHLAAGTDPNSTWAEGMLAGENIEHTCPPYEPEEGLPMLWIIAGSLLALAALIFVIMFCCMKKPKVKKTRAVKIEAKKEPAPVLMYYVAQPTVQVPQPTVVMQQPLITSAPTYTTTTAAPVVSTAPTYQVLR